jgi:hypothetical protein
VTQALLHMDILRKGKVVRHVTLLRACHRPLESDNNRCHKLGDCCREMTRGHGSGLVSSRGRCIDAWPRILFQDHHRGVVLHYRLFGHTYAPQKILFIMGLATQGCAWSYQAEYFRQFKDYQVRCSPLHRLPRMIPPGRIEVIPTLPIHVWREEVR